MLTKPMGVKFCMTNSLQPYNIFLAHFSLPEGVYKDFHTILD